MKIKGRKFGFTLTEIMIALTILGVIAALTVPGMRRDYTRRQFETAISKFYTDLMQVGPLSQVTSGKNNLSQNPSFFSNPNGCGANDGMWAKEYLRADCRGQGAVAPASGKTNGFAVSYRSLNGNQTLSRSNLCNDESGATTFVLDGGQVLCSWKYSNDEGSTYNLAIYVDMNGSKAPNIAGLDFFRLDMNLSDYNGDVYENFSGASAVESCKSSAGATGCFKSIQDNNLKITYY